MKIPLLAALLASLLIGFGEPDCPVSGASVSASHALETTAAHLHDYMHDTYDDDKAPEDDPVQQVIGASHDVEEAAAEIHDLLHDIEDGKSDDCEAVGELFGAVTDAIAAYMDELDDTDLASTDPDVRRLSGVVVARWTTLLESLVDDGVLLP